jgi:hypothetical protein
MKRRWIIGAIIALLGVTGYLLYDRAVDAMAATDYSNWPPNARAIRSALGGSNGGAADEAARVEQFCELFQNRFRHHEPMMAIGLRPLTKTRLKLMCPARLEPVDIDRVALTAWREAEDLFEHPFDLDIYATFIGMPPIKIGELRPRPDNPKFVHIVYNYRDVIVIPQIRRKADSGKPRSSQTPRLGRPSRPPVPGDTFLPPPNSTAKPHNPMDDL